MVSPNEASPQPTRRQAPVTIWLGQLIARIVRSHEAAKARALGMGPLVLAVSGGTDSLAMLLATATVHRSLKREIVVAHFSHGLRKTAERREAALVRRVTREFQICLEHGQTETGQSEASAREARYAFFERVARLHGAVAVATAHTQNDQAETLLLRLSRGAGLRGAGAIREFSERKVEGRNITLLRPLLGATRADTSAVCAEWSFTPASDGTNRSVRYARNRVRLRVLPELARINPDATRTLAAFAAVAQEDDDLLARLASEAVAGVELREPTRITWPVQTLQGLLPPLWARTLQSAWAALLGDGAVLSRRQIESMRRATARGGGAVDLGRGAVFVVEQETASLSLVRIGTPKFERISLRIPGETIAGTWAIVTCVGPASSISKDPWRATLDLDALGDEVGVRCRVEGDRFHPLGMDQEVRLQNVLVNARVPLSQRDSLPLVVAGKRIAWVAGVQIADWAKVTRKTKQSAQIEARQVS